MHQRLAEVAQRAVDLGQLMDPALRVEVTSDANPVEVGARATYTIRVVNLKRKRSKR